MKKSSNVVEELFGSMKTKVKFISHAHEIKMAGIALAKEYKKKLKRLGV